MVYSIRPAVSMGMLAEPPGERKPAGINKFIR
jgi:hypothetical protein